MKCTYTYKGKTYSQNKFYSLIKGMIINERKSSMSKPSRNNLLIDMAISNLTNKDSAEDRFKLGGFDYIMDISFDIELLRMGYTRKQLEEINKGRDAAKVKKGLIENQERDLNDLATDIYFRNQNIVGMINVPIFVNNRSAKNFFTSLKEAKILSNVGGSAAKTRFEMITNFIKSKNNEIDLTRIEYVDDDGVIRKSTDDTTEDTSAAVDISKSPVHPYLGINSQNINIYATLRLIGVDARKIASLVINPLISWNKFPFDAFKDPSDDLLDMARVFSKIFDYKLGYDLLTGMGHQTPLMDALERHGYPKDHPLSQVDIEIFVEMINFMAQGIKDVSKKLRVVNKALRADAIKGGPQLSINNMVRAEMNFNQAFDDVGSLKLVLSKDSDNNFVTNFHKYSYSKMLNVLKENFGVDFLRTFYNLFPNTSDVTIMLRNTYLNYALENVTFYDGTPITSDVIKAFPIYFFDRLKSNPKYENSWLLDNLSVTKNGFHVNSYQRPDKDKVISEWMTMYNDPEHRADAYNLAVYSFFIKDRAAGLNALYEMIPSQIQADMGIFNAIFRNPNILDDYILSEAASSVLRDKNLSYNTPDAILTKRPTSECKAALLSFINIRASKVSVVEKFYKGPDDTFYYYDYQANTLTDVVDLLKELPVDYLTNIKKIKTEALIQDVAPGQAETKSEEIQAEKPSVDEELLEDFEDEQSAEEVFETDVKVFNSPHYKDIKNIDSLSDKLQAMEAAILKLLDTDNAYAKGVSEAIVSYLEDESSIVHLPEFENMDENDVFKEINDALSCM